MRPLPPHDPVREAALRRWYQRTGYALLAAGLLGALVASFTVAPRPEPGPNFDVPSAQTSKVYELNEEKLGGKAIVLTNEWMDGFRSLWHGRRLPYTLLVLGVAGAALCFGIAHLLGLPPHEAERREHEP